MQPIPVLSDPERLRAELNGMTPEQQVRAAVRISGVGPWAAFPFPPRPWVSDGLSIQQERRSKTKAYTRRHLRLKRDEDARRHKAMIEAKRARRRR